MRRIFCTYLSIVISLFAFAVHVSAQQHINKIDILPGEFTRRGDSMYVSMVIDYSKMPFHKTQSFTLTPTITGANHRQKELNKIMIAGSISEKKYKRSLKLKKADSIGNGSIVIVYNGNPDNKLAYSQAIPYEEWMNGSRLDVQEDDCGCGSLNGTNIQRVAGYTAPVVYVMQPRLVYIEPEATAKSRKEEWDVFLDFPVNRMDILPDFEDNPVELQKIETMFSKIAFDKNATITHIHITGYASPEGTVANNEKLSRGRAEALKEQLMSKFRLPVGVCSISYGGENWDGLVAAVEKSDMSDKGKILRIIGTENIASRKKQLKAFKKGAPYRQLLTEVYPHLRKAMLHVSYSIRNFSSGEAKELIKTQPQQLSLNELFLVSNSYLEGSADFTNVFEAAVKLYPESKAANLNAASAAIAAKNMNRAKQYLEKSDKNSAEYFNNIGVMYMYENSLEAAKIWLSKAAEQGLEVAKYNLKEIEKLQKK